MRTLEKVEWPVAPLCRALAGAVMLSALLISCSPGSDKAKAKAIFIIVDGIPTDVIEKLDPPALADIAKQGGYTRAYVGGAKGTHTETPTVSAVGYNSLLTGTWVHKHNVRGNNIKDPNYHYRDIFRIVETHRPALKTAVFSTWTDNRTKLIGEGLPATGNLTLDYKFDGLELDTIRYPHDDSSVYIHRIDEAVAADAARYLREEGPDLSWVYLQFTDDMGHRHGDGKKFYDAVMTADRQVDRIWKAIREREKEFGEDWMIVITTDHGRDAETGKNHGGQSDRERLSWIVTNAAGLNERFRQTPAVVDIMPSLARHLGVELPEVVKEEIDGVPFIGKADLSDVRADRAGGLVTLRWKSLGTEPVQLEVFVSETNHFKTGGRDQYRKVGEVKATEQRFSFANDRDSAFCKILLKGPNHYANAWIVPQRPG